MKNEAVWIKRLVQAKITIKTAFNYMPNYLNMVACVCMFMSVHFQCTSDFWPHLNSPVGQPNESCPNP